MDTKKKNIIVKGLSFIPDRLYLKLIYFIKMHKRLNLKNPQTFNEKLQWLKLYDRRPEYTTMVDKYEVKKYVADIIGDEYIIPTLGVWDKFEDIDFDSLPEQFVLKCTHDSGGIVIVKDKSKMDMAEAREKINRSLKNKFFYYGREWPYKNVKPRIIAEKYMVDESGYELKDYKVFNFNGEAKVIQVDFDRFIQHLKNLYTTDWKFIKAEMNYPSDPSRKIDRPEKLDEMLSLAKKLSAEIPFVRTDFYSINDKIYFGEITFFPASGYAPFQPESFDEDLGKLIKLNGGGYLLTNEGYMLLFNPAAADNAGIRDYKFFCFNGAAKCMKVDFDRFIEHHANYYDMNKNQLNFGEAVCPPAYDRVIEIPESFNLMRELAEKLAEEIPFLRADFYDVSGQVYFGELTFYPASGLGKFIPETWDKNLGEWIKLPDSIGGGIC